MWRRREWRKLLNLIDRMPRDSHTRQAMALDEEHVEMVQTALETIGEDRDTAGGPLLSEWSLNAELLAQVIDALTVNTHATMAAAGAKTPKFKPVRRPQTAYERVQHRRRLAGHDRVVAMVKSATAKPQADPLASLSASEKGTR